MYTFAHTYGPCGFPWWLGFSGGGGHPLSLLGVRASIRFPLGSDAEPHQERRMAAATLSKRNWGRPPPKVDAYPTHQKDAEDDHHQRLAAQATGFAARRTCYHSLRGKRTVIIMFMSVDIHLSLYMHVYI